MVFFARIELMLLPILAGILIGILVGILVGKSDGFA
jgi:hypothetical protein